jgi:hypothetical protein
LNTTTTTAIVKKLKEGDQDYDFYPSTTEILECIKNHSQKTLRVYERDEIKLSILDIGAGTARAANVISCGGVKKVIEISQILINEMPFDCIPVGSDFLQSNIVPIESDIIFSNPPYSASGGYVIWSEKIILEGNAKLIYLVIPNRWRNNERIKIAIEEREATAEIIGEFDFLNAERKARAKVDVVCIDLCKNKDADKRYGRRTHQIVDPFDIWIKKTFVFDAPKDKHKAALSMGQKDSGFDKRMENQLVTGRNQVESLVNLYDQELQQFKDLYEAVAKIPYSQLKVLGASVKGLESSVKENLSVIKRKYWEELFLRYEPITSKLTTNTRSNMLYSMHKQVNIDFNVPNAYNVTTWVIKGANRHFDSQLIETYKKLINKTSIQKYKSNKKTFDNEDWRWSRNLDELGKYCLKLEYRIIVSGYGWISNSYNNTNGLCNPGHDLLNDIGVLAYNLGFPKTQKSESFDWTQGQVNFTFPNDTIFMQCCGHLNGNLHLKINVEALKAISIKFGALMGWIKSAHQASEEMDIPLREAQEHFQRSHEMLPGDGLLKITN